MDIGIKEEEVCRTIPTFSLVRPTFSKVNLEKDRLSLRCLGINLGRKLAARYVILDSEERFSLEKSIYGDVNAEM